MKRAVEPNSVGSESASESEGTSTLAYVDPPPHLRDEDNPISGVRKLPAPEHGAPEAAERHEVGAYRLIEPIGEGAMGHVYRAEHMLLGRVVAIKMLRSELTCDDACVRRFLAEARAVNLIKHPHVIDVTDFACTPSGQPWFVMELLEGSDLSLAATREPLSLPRTLEIVRQLCEALTSVHTAGIVHRDVKPENVFLQQREGKDFITLIDFGIARLPDPTNADPRQEGLMGTSYYMAPEQAAASPIDHRADLYAVGSTLFELVAGIGSTPFRAEQLQQQLMDVMMTPAPRLSDRAKVPAIVRGDLDRLVARLLAKQPEDRPASAREVADELALIAGKLAAHTSGARSPKKKAPSRSRPRARRPAHAGNVRSSHTAIMLAAVAAAAAMWLATREGDWPRALRNAFSNEAPARSSEHVVTPMNAPTDLPVSTPVAPPAGSAQQAAGVEAAPDAARAPKPKRPLNRKGNRAEPAERAPDEAVAGEKAARASEQPSLMITPAEPIAPPPAPEPEPAPAPAPEPARERERSYDRDLVLNPFDR
jgi:serine/threonine-protein kinase